MSYATIVARAQSLIQALDTYADADVSLGDYRILESGSAPYVILRAGPLENVFRTPTRRQRTWTIMVELYERMVGDGTEEANLTANREELVVLFDKYPTLNSLSADVTGAQIIGGDEPVIALHEKGGGIWLMTILTLTVNEQYTVTGGEYA